MKNIIRIFGYPVAVSAFALLCLAVLVPSRASAEPFGCEVGFYQIITGQLTILDPATGEYNSIGSAIPNNPNAFGYNVQDNYIYGINNGAGSQGNLLRVSNDGSYIDLGLPTGLPEQAYVSGDFDYDGNLWVSQFGSSSTLYSIDVSEGTATSLSLSQSMFISEFVHIDGFVYATAGTTFYRINLTTGVVTPFVELPGLPTGGGPNAAYGAGWATADGGLYFSHNVSGIIYQITGYTGGSPEAMAVLQGAIPLSNDGAACPYAMSPLSGFAAVNDQGRVKANGVLSVSAAQGLLANDTGQGIYVSSYTQPTNGSVTVEPDGSYIYRPNAGYVGVDTFTYTIMDEFGQTTTATVTIDVDNGIHGDAVESELANTGTTVKSYYLIVAGLIVAAVGLQFQKRSF